MSEEPLCQEQRVDRVHRRVRRCGRTEWHVGRHHFTKVAVRITLPLGDALRRLA